MKLTRAQQTIITDIISDLYYRLEARLLGKYFKGPSMYFSVISETDPLDTLEGAYRYALSHMYGSNAAVDEHEMKSLNDIAGNYLEAARLKNTNAILNDIKGISTPEEIDKVIQVGIDKATSYINTLVVTETTNMTAYASKEGITRLAAAIGDDNPTIVKLGIVDNKLCKACKELWHSASNLHKPRPWRLSELQDGYNKSQQNPIPTHNATHPHCRHQESFVPSGYGFNESGVIQFVGFGYSYYDDYYEVHKHEVFSEDLIKSCTCSHSEILEEP